MLQANASWGQYALCKFNGTNYCNVGDERYVGRECPYGLDRMMGQCTDNFVSGSWFSFPAKGQCQPGQPLGSNGCTWGPGIRLRTVQASCILQDRKMEEVCK